MDIGALLLLFVLLLLVALFVAWPFMEKRRRLPVEDPARSALLAEQERLLSTLQELDFDHGLGKLPEQEYPAQRLALLQHGAAILKQLDEADRLDKRRAKDKLESALAARRAKLASTPTGGASEEDLENMIARRRSARKEKAAGFCPGCGHAVLQSDRFCPQCGRPLK